jgi:hypothetical protein
MRCADVGERGRFVLDERGVVLDGFPLRGELILLGFKLVCAAPVFADIVGGSIISTGGASGTPRQRLLLAPNLDFGIRLCRRSGNAQAQGTASKDERYHETRVGMVIFNDFDNFAVVENLIS